MPIDYKKYPTNWKTYIRPSIAHRAGNMCEGSDLFPHCRVRNYSAHSVTGSKVVLTVAHIDQDIRHNDNMDNGGMLLPKPLSNLRFLCQRCYLSWDRHYRKNKQMEVKKCR